MLIISNRGNVHGPDPSTENHPNQVSQILDAGVNVKVDVRYNNGRWMLGDSWPDHEVSEDFLKREGLWLQARNEFALVRLLDMDVNCFWHDGVYSLTSRNFIWAVPPHEAVLPKGVGDKMVVLTYGRRLAEGVYATCTDYLGQ